MIKRLRHKLTAAHRPFLFRWPESKTKVRATHRKGHVKTLHPKRDRILMLSAGVFAAMLIGGVIGWVGATMMKSDPSLSHSLKPTSMKMPKLQEERQSSPEVIAKLPSEVSPQTSMDTPSSEQPPFEQSPLFTEEALKEAGVVVHPEDTSKLYEEPLPPEMEVAPHETHSEPQIAALPPAEQGKPDVSSDKATWLKNSVAFVPKPNVPMIAIVIDDVGIDLRHSAQVVQMPAPITLSYLSYARNLRKQAKEAQLAGHELVLHMPMEPFGAGYDPGPDVLLTSMTSKEIKARLNKSLNSFSGYVGINNHMGSKFTSDVRGVSAVMQVLKARGLLFLDSLTTGKSVAAKTATKFGVPNLTRHVFLDNSPKPSAIRVQIRRLEKLAKKHGSAIAIGHPRRTTVEALKVWLPKLKEKGIQLVPLSTLAKIKYGIL